MSFSTWSEYSKAQDKYVKAKSALQEQMFSKGENLTMGLFWDGDGHNPNAALTVFRHFDSASVVQGLIGEPPLTAWVIDYPVLERIHYLLVAGYDVFGALGHQLTTRRYMDFLRMEGESKALLPEQDTLTIVKDFIGSYPSAYWRVTEEDLPALVEQINRLNDAASYRALMDQFGVRRTATNFN